MNDPIERQEAINSITNLTFNFTIGGKRGFQNYKEEVKKIFVAIRDKYIEALKALPSVEAETVRHGKWEVIHYDNIHTVGECSECKAICRLSNYCPNCGAKMDIERRTHDN